MTDARKHRKIPFVVKLEIAKVILYSHPESDQHYNLITSWGWFLVNAYQVWSTSINAFVSYRAHTIRYDTILCI